MRDLSRGRPPLYSGLLASLDPLWYYSAAAITEFAYVHNLLALLVPGTASVSKKKARIRIALGRRRNMKGFPAEGDAKIVLRGRHLPAWFGWRWQDFNNPQAAFFSIFLQLRSIWQTMVYNRFYTIDDLMAIWARLPLPNIHPDLKGNIRGKTNWREFNRIQTQTMLVRHGQRRGLDMGKAYLADKWCKPVNRLAPVKRLKTFVRHLNPNSIYSPSSIVELIWNMGLLRTAPREYAMRIRASFFRLARNNHFPESGDMMLYPNGQVPQPGWAGSRWMTAVGLDLTYCLG